MNLHQQFTIREVVTDSDFQEYHNITKQSLPEWSEPLQDILDSFKNVPEGVKRYRVFLEENGTPFGGVNVVQSFWQKDKGHYHADLNPKPNLTNDQYRFHFEHMIQASESQGAKALNMWICEIFPEIIQLAPEFGFEKDQENPESRMFLSDFNPESFMASVQKLSESELEVLTMDELLERDPENGLRRYWLADNLLSKDIPMPFEFVGTEFEIYERGFMRDKNSFSTILVVLDQEEIVATTMLFRNKILPDLFHTGLTAVHRDYRRRGIAKAIKTMNLTKAKELGGTTVNCDNEENNPMLQLNLELGFKPFRTWTSFTRKS
ncbi:MAG: N-acetyltransferase family protein [Fimbriimonadaceae bacterium]